MRIGISEDKILEGHFAASALRIRATDGPILAYTMLATFVQLFGGDEAFAFMADLHQNISHYTQSGSAPTRAAATGETAVGIVFMHDAVAQAVQGAPIITAAPCEGTGYEVGSMSIIAGAPNPENARIWYDWALSAEAQEIGVTANSYQVPSNANAATPPEAPISAISS